MIDFSTGKINLWEETGKRQIGKKKKPKTKFYYN